MYEQKTTLADVRADNPETIYYGVNTCWWTHRPEYLYREGGLPCDPRGGMLMQTDDPEAFLKAAEDNPEAYGKHGITAFEAALMGNVTAPNGRPTCYKTWDEYNAAIDAAGEQD